MGGNGQFTLVSKLLRTGYWPFSVVSSNAQGGWSSFGSRSRSTTVSPNLALTHLIVCLLTAESLPADAGTALILPSPSIWARTLVGQNWQINGTGNPSALFKMYQNGTFLSSQTIAGDGKWSVSATLQKGVYNMTMTQEDSVGVSDLGMAGIVAVLV